MAVFFLKGCIYRCHFHPQNETLLSRKLDKAAASVCHCHQKFLPLKAQERNATMVLLLWRSPPILGTEAGAGMLRDTALLQGQTGLKRRVISLSVEWGQRGKLTCCFSCPATVGAASAVPHHQLSALHHWLKRLSANTWTVRMKQSSKLKCGVASFCFGPIILFLSFLNA